MRTTLQRWIVGTTAAFGAMAFVVAAAMLAPPEPENAARIASGCPSKVKGPVAAVPGGA